MRRIMYKRRILLDLLIFIVLLTACGNPKNNEDKSSNKINMDTSETTSISEIHEATKPEGLKSYGTSINIARCVNVDGTIEYLPNTVPFEYNGTDVRYNGIASFEYEYKNGYFKDKIQCLALLFYDGQYIDFSVNDSDMELRHILEAEYKEDNNYVVDFDFLFYPYGIDKGELKEFYIMLVPLYPLNMNNGAETIDVLPIRIAAVKGSVISKESKCEYKACTSILQGQAITSEDDIEEYISHIYEARGTGVNTHENVIINKDGIFENIILINEKKESLDNTIITVTICDNNIMNTFSGNEILSVDATKDAIINSYIDTSSMEQGKHTIYTVSIIKDNIKNRVDIYRSNFVDIIVQ